MSKFKVEIIDKSGEMHYTRTINVPKSFNGDIRTYLMDKMHKKIQPEPEYRHTYPAFWREYTLLQYWRV